MRCSVVFIAAVAAATMPVVLARHPPRLEHAKQGILSAEVNTLRDHHRDPHRAKKTTAESSSSDEVNNDRHHPSPKEDIVKKTDAITTNTGASNTRVVCDPNLETGKLSCGINEYCKKTWRGAGYCASFKIEGTSRTRTTTTTVTSARQLQDHQRHIPPKKTPMEANHHPTPAKDISKTIVSDRIECDPKVVKSKLSCGPAEYCKKTWRGAGYCAPIKSHTVQSTTTTASRHLQSRNHRHPPKKTPMEANHHPTPAKDIRVEAEKDLSIKKTNRSGKVACDHTSLEAKLVCGPMAYCKPSRFGDFCAFLDDESNAESLTTSTSAERQLQSSANTSSWTNVGIFATVTTSIVSLYFS
jgi:hypothetical protein